MDRKPSPYFKEWLAIATTEEQLELARRVDTSRQYLYQLSGGFRRVSPELAARIEAVTKDMNQASEGRLPVIYRTDVCSACRKCEFALTALGDVAVRADFEQIED